MAANSKSTQGIASLGKRVVKQIWTVNNSSRFAAAGASTAARRATHTSAYDKNLDDQVRPSVVPDEVIQPLSDKYWAPHPQTGVFGPATEPNSGAGGERGFSTSPAKAGNDTVLEEKAWFRPTSIEDLEKPHHV
ncbi:late embryogenesis abundant protein At5g17165 [Ricinus communis]|uniref:Hydrogen peroxide induced protein 1 n=1 Tax=Ricinus communis TaxID=3988 RepID=B9S1Y1_RICCO|nr:late embryogenesis abundant protein At5g17165 [Ricinus communis]EEF42324.1 conserved hypothetical protein [Ricinus communis]|eukprot:XP_015575220.1 late embryogenesis abundant protein At5g17165 [Ricinus communis]